MAVKNNLNKNFTTSHAGLAIYAKLWNKFNLPHIFDSLVPKHSGAKYSKIAQNLFSRNLIDANSMSALSDVDKQEYFLRKNASLNRTTYGRNLKRLNNKLRKNILTKFNNNFISHREINNDSIFIYDTSPIKAEGENYENTEWVWDACEEKMICGYALNKLLLSTKNKLAVIDFELQNKDKDKTIEMFKRGRRLYGINKIVFDAGPDIRGMDFYKKLDEEDFLFYTKAVSSWYFNYGKDYTVEGLKKIIKSRLKREGIVSLEVWKDDMLLRLIFVLNDARVYLTNDLEIPAGKVIQYYNRRWDIELSFREEKQNLGLNTLPCWNEEGIKTHILLVLLAFVLSQLIINKVGIVKGIKLIKRRIVNVYAKVKELFNRVYLIFNKSYKLWWVFSLEFG